MTFFENFEFNKILSFYKILFFFWKFLIFWKFSIGGLYSPTKSLWWLVWSHKITVVACMDPQNHCGGLYGPTKSLWWPVWSHKIYCGGLSGPTKSTVVACMDTVVLNPQKAVILLTYFYLCCIIITSIETKI